LVARGDYETMDIHDERTKELAQILINDKAIAILHLLEDRALSISEIARELNLPISTVSYHVDKMLKVGLIEVAGKKYGKRLQEVKLYRASNRPILLVPRKSVAKVKKKRVLGLERLHVISLGVAGLVSAGVYTASTRVLSPVASSGGNVTVMSERSLVGVTQSTSPQATSHFPAMPAILAIAAFILTFLLISHFLKRRA
jgi:DNA-binding transcriptional ArsR family regulator